MSDLVTLDVGNTTVTATRWEQGTVTARWSFIHASDFAGLARVLDLLPRSALLALVSVNRDAADRVAARVPRPLRLLRAPVDFQAPVGNACDPPDAVGQDRLFNAAGAEQWPCVLVDAGTAITVDLVDRAGVFRGGAIAPGVGLSFRALHQHTAQLPGVVVRPGDETPRIGADTASALRCGVVRGLAGLVDRLIEEVGGGVEEVVLTGGDAELLGPLFRRPVRRDQDLMSRGIARAVGVLAAGARR